MDLRLSELIGALSTALDVTEGLPAGHAARSCVLGVRLGARLGLEAEERCSLFYALLLKDVGCSSTSAQVAAIYGNDDQAVKSTLHWVDRRKPLEVLRDAVHNAEPNGGGLARARRLAHLVRNGPEQARVLRQIRCDRGADIARMIGLDEPAVEAIRAANEHWDGGGVPAGLAGDAIPVLGRIVGLAQTVEVELTRGGIAHATQTVAERAGTWFDPSLAAEFVRAAAEAAFWEGMDDPRTALAPLEPADRLIVADDERLDRVAEAFARVIDAKSPYTARHSEGVAHIAVQIAGVLGFSRRETRDLRRAALLHDIGKLGISNRILDKPGRLDEAEWAQMRRHPELTARILGQVEPLRGIAEVAAAHHERLDGSGYHLGLDGSRLGPAARVLAVADVADALSADRPYREGLPPDVVLEIIGRDAGTALDADACVALREAWQPAPFLQLAA
jgi:putative nucleotidyltransferase with HDIG domain